MWDCDHQTFLLSSLVVIFGEDMNEESCRLFKLDLVRASNDKQIINRLTFIPNIHNLQRFIFRPAPESENSRDACHYCHTL